MKIIVVIIYFCSYSGLFLIGKDFFVEYLILFYYYRYLIDKINI